MAVPANTVQTHVTVHNAEEFGRIISMISPTETPFYCMVKKTKTKSREPQWLVDKLANPNPANMVVEGNDVTPNAMGQPERRKNYTQIFDRTVAVSDTSRAIETIGRADELKRLVAKAGAELKRDVEARLCGNYGSATGANAVPSQMAGAEAWITTNVNKGVGGVEGGFQTGTGLVTTRTDGTARPLTEAMLKDVHAKVWNSGGEATTVLMSGAKKQTASTFPGIAALQNEVSNGGKKITIQGSADYYQGDFGTLKLIPTRFVGASATRTANSEGLYPGNSVLVLDKSTWEIKFLQPWGMKNLAVTGHNEKRMLKCEITLACTNEASNAIIADLS